MAPRKIIAAAIRYRNGEIYVGSNHGACFAAYAESLKKRFGENFSDYISRDYEDGFMDDLGNFQDRCDSFDIAKPSLKSDINGRKPEELLGTKNGRPMLDSSALSFCKEDLEKAQRYADANNQNLKKQKQKSIVL